MLISASLLLPLSVLLWFTIAEFNRVIHLAELERAGLELETPLTALRDRTGRHQVLAHLRAAGVTGLETGLAREGDEISAAFDQLVTVHDRVGKDLAAAGATGSRGPDPKTLREDWNRLRGQVSRLDPAESDRRHEELRQAIRSLADQVANASQLVLDPELASFYLVDAAVVALPRLNDRLTSIEATAAPLLLHSVAQPRLVRRRLGETAALLRESDLERIGTSLQAARQANPGLRVMDDAFASQFDPLLDQLGALANPEPAEALPIFARTEPAAPEPPNGEFESALDRSRRAAIDLWGSAADELDRLLRARIERFQGRRLLALLLTGVALALSAGLIVGTGRSITRPLQRCVAGLQALADRDLRETIRVQAGGEVGAIAASLNLAIGNLRSLLGRIQLTSVSVMTGLNQFTANARQQQRLADDYRQATSETAVAINEITTTAQELLRGMNGVQALIAQTTDLAQSGQQALTALELSIRRLSQLTEALGVQLSATQGRAENIDLMVTTIIKVADETNLLSINAAIEAEKAGEHGRGFAVVAREIRRLADQTAVATLDIERTVAEMHQSLTTGASQMELVQEAVQSGVSEVQQLSEQLSRIVTAVEDLEPEFQHVQDGMTMQSHGAEQIRDAMHRLSEQAHGSLNSLQEFNRATEQLREAIQELSQDVALFLLPGMTPRPAPASEPEPDPDQSDTGAPDDSEPFPPPPPPDLEPGAMPDFSTF